MIAIRARTASLMVAGLLGLVVVVAVYVRASAVVSCGLTVEDHVRVLVARQRAVEVEIEHRRIEDEIRRATEVRETRPHAGVDGKRECVYRLSAPGAPRRCSVVCRYRID